MEALRSRNRDQTTLIERLQTELVRFRSNGTEGSQTKQGEPPEALALVERNRILADEVEALKLKLQGHEDKRMGVSPTVMGDGQSGQQVDAQLLQNEVKKLREKTTAQADEIESLSSELNAMASGSQDSNKPVIRLTKRVLSAKITALEKRTERQAETIARLRAELASSNERAARQAASYMKEMRQIGLGPLSQPYEVRNKDGALSKSGRAALRSRPVGNSNHNRNISTGQQNANTSSIAPPAATGQSPAGTPVTDKIDDTVAKASSESGVADSLSDKPKPAASKTSDVVESAQPKRKRLIDRISRHD